MSGIVVPGVVSNCYVLKPLGFIPKAQSCQSLDRTLSLGFRMVRSWSAKPVVVGSIPTLESLEEQGSLSHGKTSVKTAIIDY